MKAENWRESLLKGRRKTPQKKTGNINSKAETGGCLKQYLRPVTTNKKEEKKSGGVLVKCNHWSCYGARGKKERKR